jgi:hypothetical protein
MSDQKSVDEKTLPQPKATPRDAEVSLRALLAEPFHSESFQLGLRRLLTSGIPLSDNFFYMLGNCKSFDRVKCAIRLIGPHTNKFNYVDSAGHFIMGVVNGGYYCSTELQILREMWLYEVPESCWSRACEMLMYFLDDLESLKWFFEVQMEALHLIYYPWEKSFFLTLLCMQCPLKVFEWCMENGMKIDMPYNLINHAYWFDEEGEDKELVQFLKTHYEAEDK